MKSSWTIAQRLSLGFATAVLIVLALAVSSHRSIRRLIEDDYRVQHSQQVRQDIAALISLLYDAETRERGYVITGDESFIGHYRSKVLEIEERMESARKLTSDDADQQRRLDQLRPLLSEKLADLNEQIEVRRTQGFEALVKRVTEGRGQAFLKANAFLDKIHRIIAEMDEHEKGLLQSGYVAAGASSKRARAVTLWGGLIGCLLLVGFGIVLSRNLKRQIGDSVRHIQSSSSELEASSRQQEIGAKELAASMTQISTTINELQATSRQIAESAQRVSQIAVEAAKSASSGDQTVQKTQETMSSIRRQVDAIVAYMLDLGKKSQQIGGILEVINDLSDQTNILAINASVEAAGAGESGRRFGVVADEIRKLADRVGGSAKEIRSLIEGVSTAVNTTVMATESGSKAVDNGAKMFAEVATSFRNIAGLVGTSTEAAREIELSTRQQSTAVDQVNIGIKRIAEASRETEVGSNQTLKTVSALASLSKELALLIQSAPSGPRGKA